MPRDKWLRGTPKNGWAPIHQAAHRGHTEIVKALAECIDNPNPQENGICTAIHLAEEIGQTESVQALINCTNNLDLVSECCSTCLNQIFLKVTYQNRRKMYLNGTLLGILSDLVHMHQ